MFDTHPLTSVLDIRLCVVDVILFVPVAAVLPYVFVPVQQEICWRAVQQSQLRVLM